MILWQLKRMSYQRSCLFIGGMLLTPFIRLYELIGKWSSAALVIEDLTLLCHQSAGSATAPLPLYRPVVAGHR